MIIDHNLRKRVAKMSLPDKMLKLSEAIDEAVDHNDRHMMRVSHQLDQNSKI